MARLGAHRPAAPEPSKRADVIPFGAVLFETAMRMLDFTHLRVSKRGIRYAAVQLRPED